MTPKPSNSTKKKNGATGKNAVVLKFQTTLKEKENEEIQPVTMKSAKSNYFPARPPTRSSVIQKEAIKMSPFENFKHENSSLSVFEASRIWLVVAYIFF
jgi:hypothetical protein